MTLVSFLSFAKQNIYCVVCHLRSKYYSVKYFYIINFILARCFPIKFCNKQDMEVAEFTSIEKYFKTYFQHLSTFAWDKAKEFVEKEKQQLPTSLLVCIYYSTICNFGGKGVIYCIVQ